MTTTIEEVEPGSDPDNDNEPEQPPVTSTPRSQLPRAVARSSIEIEQNLRRPQQAEPPGTDKPQPPKSQPAEGPSSPSRRRGRISPERQPRDTQPTLPPELQRRYPSIIPKVHQIVEVKDPSTQETGSSGESATQRVEDVGTRYRLLSRGIGNTPQNYRSSHGRSEAICPCPLRCTLAHRHSDSQENQQIQDQVQPIPNMANILSIAIHESEILENDGQDRPKSPPAMQHQGSQRKRGRPTAEASAVLLPIQRKGRDPNDNYQQMPITEPLIAEQSIVGERTLSTHFPNTRWSRSISSPENTTMPRGSPHRDLMSTYTSMPQLFPLIRSPQAHSSSSALMPPLRAPQFGTSRQASPHRSSALQQLPLRRPNPFSIWRSPSAAQ